MEGGVLRSTWNPPIFCDSTIIDVITKGHIFGLPKCWIYTIEWQKWGLPHSHNLIWLADKIQPTQINDVISAELPDPTQDSELLRVVTKNMIHGPCGNLNPNSPCMKDGKCTKKYPRKLIKKTQTGNYSYPLHRRWTPEDGGFTEKLKICSNTEIKIDKRGVVPFLPLLSRMFLAHINVEYCNSVKLIKYEYKYVNKGSDMAVFGIHNERINDEVMRYQLEKYINSTEAVWRMLGFQIHERQPTVVHLSVHLDNGQSLFQKIERPYSGWSATKHDLNSILWTVSAGSFCKDFIVSWDTLILHMECIEESFL